MDMVPAAHFVFGSFGTLFRMRLRDEPGRPELKSRGFHTPVENAITAIYLPGTSGCHSATRPGHRLHGPHRQTHLLQHEKVLEEPESAQCACTLECACRGGCTERSFCSPGWVVHAPSPSRWLTSGMCQAAADRAEQRLYVREPRLHVDVDVTTRLRWTWPTAT